MYRYFCSLIVQCAIRCLWGGGVKWGVWRGERGERGKRGSGSGREEEGE